MVVNLVDDVSLGPLYLERATAGASAAIRRRLASGQSIKEILSFELASLFAIISRCFHILLLVYVSLILGGFYLSRGGTCQVPDLISCFLLMSLYFIHTIVILEDTEIEA